MEINLLMKNQNSFPNLHTVYQNFTHIGLLNFIGKLMEFLHVMVFYLIMKAQEEEKLLLQEK